MQPLAAELVGRWQTLTRERDIHQRFNDLGFSYSQEWAISDKCLINYCRVEWIRGGDTPCSSNSGCADWLRTSIFRYILATIQETLYGQFNHKISSLQTQEDRSMTYFQFCQR